jgi:hypothetical protein
MSEKGHTIYLHLSSGKDDAGESRGPRGATVTVLSMVLYVAAAVCAQQPGLLALQLCKHNWEAGAACHGVNDRLMHRGGSCR